MAASSQSDFRAQLKKVLVHEAWYSDSLEAFSIPWTAARMRGWMGTPARAVKKYLTADEGLSSITQKENNYGRDALFAAIIGGVSRDIIKYIIKVMKEQSGFKFNKLVSSPIHFDAPDVFSGPMRVTPLHACVVVGNYIEFKNILAEMAKEDNDMSKAAKLTQILIGYDDVLPLNTMLNSDLVNISPQFAAYFEKLQEEAENEANESSEADESSEVESSTSFAGDGNATEIMEEFFRNLGSISVDESSIVSEEGDDWDFTKPENIPDLKLQIDLLRALNAKASRDVSRANATVGELTEELAEMSVTAQTAKNIVKDNIVKEEERMRLLELQMARSRAAMEQLKKDQQKLGSTISEQSKPHFVHFKE